MLPKIVLLEKTFADFSNKMWNFSKFSTIILRDLSFVFINLGKFFTFSYSHQCWEPISKEKPSKHNEFVSIALIVAILRVEYYRRFYETAAHRMPKRQLSRIAGNLSTTTTGGVTYKILISFNYLFIFQMLSRTKRISWRNFFFFFRHLTEILQMLHWKKKKKSILYLSSKLEKHNSTGLLVNIFFLLIRVKLVSWKSRDLWRRFVFVVMKNFFVVLARKEKKNKKKMK